MISHKKGLLFTSNKLIPIKASLFRNEKDHHNYHLFSEEEAKKVELPEELIN